MSSSTWEKFRGATLSLARSGAIKERLTDAYRNYLAFVDEEDLPRELRDEFRAFSHAVTRERPLLRGEDAFRATVRKMSAEEADQLASGVVRMFCALPRGYAGQARSTQPAQVVPLAHR